MDAQGEDVVAGIRTPHPISKLKEEMPEVYAELEEIYLKLEKHYATYGTSSSPSRKVNPPMLQTRTGKMYRYRCCTHCCRNGT